MGSLLLRGELGPGQLESVREVLMRRPSLPAWLRGGQNEGVEGALGAEEGAGGWVALGPGTLMADDQTLAEQLVGAEGERGLGGGQQVGSKRKLQLPDWQTQSGLRYLAGFRKITGRADLPLVAAPNRTLLHACISALPCMPKKLG